MNEEITLIMHLLVDAEKFHRSHKTSVLGCQVQRKHSRPKIQGRSGTYRLSW
jgi:hypothetical protein